MNMEEELIQLFDYQRFEQNERLAGIIDETEKRVAAEISDDDMEMLSAAGEIYKVGKADDSDKK